VTLQDAQSRRPQICQFANAIDATALTRSHVASHDSVATTLSEAMASCGGDRAFAHYGTEKSHFLMSTGSGGALLSGMPMRPAWMTVDTIT
jgi:hypothetical protein